jgi:hypothetical protein
MPLARQQNKPHQTAQRIDERHNLGCQPAPRCADGLILSPPFAPAPCRWTFTIVPSMRAYSKSGSGDNFSKIVSNTPLSAQRRNRLHTVNHLPKSSGRSRQGAPVRTIHNTASRKSRLSSPDRPGSPSLPGSRGAMRCHCLSFRAFRIPADLHFSALNQISRVKGILNVYRP